VYVGSLVANDELVLAVAVEVGVAVFGMVTGAVELLFIVMTVALAVIETLVFVLFAA